MGGTNSMQDGAKSAMKGRDILCGSQAGECFHKSQPDRFLTAVVPRSRCRRAPRRRTDRWRESGDIEEGVDGPRVSARP